MARPKILLSCVSNNMYKGRTDFGDYPPIQCHVECGAAQARDAPRAHNIMVGRLG